MSEAARLSVIVDANVGGAQRGLMGVQRSAAGAAKSMAKFAAVSAGLAGVGAAVAGVVKTTVDFDKSMRNVNSIAQLNEGQFRKLSSSVKDLAGPTAQAPKTLADGLYDLVSSGFDAKQSLTILKSSARAATAGLTDTATSTKAVAAVLNAYHRPASAAAAVSDDLFQTVDSGVLSFEALAQNIGDVLPFSAALGVDLKQVGAATATMTKAGVSAPETMTRIKGAMSQLIKPSEDLKKVYKELGVASGEDLIRQTGSLQGALQALEATTGGSKEQLAKLFPDIRALGGALLLTGKNAKSANADLAAFKNDSGATSTALKEQAKSVSFAWQQFKAELSSAAIDVGSLLIPAMAKGAKGAGDLVEKFRSGEGDIGRFGQSIADIATTVAPVGEALARLVSSGTSAFFSALASTAAHAAATITDIGGAIGSVFSGDFSGAFSKLGSAVTNVTHLVTSAFSAMTAPLQSAAAALGGALVGPFTAAASAILGVFSSMMSGISAAFGSLAGIPVIGDLFGSARSGAKRAAGDIDRLRESIRSIGKESPTVVVRAKTDAALHALDKVQGTVLRAKVFGILAKDSDAKSKLRALIAIGIPRKTAMVLADIGNALSGVATAQGAINSLHGKTVTISVLTNHTIRNAIQNVVTTTKQVMKGKAAGRGPGHAEFALVGEGRGPEFVGSRANGWKLVTAPTVMNLSAQDSVIPTDPAYSARAAMIAQQAGFPGYAGGKGGKNEPVSQVQTGTNPVTKRRERHTAKEWARIRKDYKDAQAEKKKKAKAKKDAAADRASNPMSLVNLDVAAADVAAAQVTAGTTDDMSAFAKQSTAVTARLKAVKNALSRKGLKRADRRRLLGEQASLLGQRGSIAQSVADLAPAAGFTGAQFAQAGVAQASLTPGLGDDVSAARSLVDAFTADLKAAQATGDPTKIAEAASNLKGASDQLDSASQAVKDAATKVIDDKISAFGADVIKAKVGGSVPQEIAAVTGELAAATEAFNAAAAASDIEGIQKYGGEVLSLRGDLKTLSESITGLTDTMQAQLDLTKQALDEARRALNTSAAEQRAMGKYLVGLVNQQVGQMVGRRSGTPRPLALSSY